MRLCFQKGGDIGIVGDHKLVSVLSAKMAALTRWDLLTIRARFCETLE
jgi:hypothetical protein